MTRTAELITTIPRTVDAARTLAELRGDGDNRWRTTCGESLTDRITRGGG